MAQSTVAGAFGELDLDDDLWFDPHAGAARPTRAAAARDRLVERTGFAAQRLQATQHVVQPRLVEACPDVARVPQLARLVVAAQDE